MCVLAMFYAHPIGLAWQPFCSEPHAVLLLARVGYRACCTACTLCRDPARCSSYKQHVLHFESITLNASQLALYVLAAGQRSAELVLN